MKSLYDRMAQEAKKKTLVCRGLSQPVVLLSLVAVTLWFIWTSLHNDNWTDLDLDNVVRVFKQEKTTTNINLLDSRTAALQLSEIYKNLQHSALTKSPPNLSDLKMLETVITQIYPPISSLYQKSWKYKSANNAEVVCPEQYDGPKAGGWHVVNCTTARPLEELVTMVININGVPINSIKTTALQLLQDFEHSFPGMTVLLVGSGLSKAEISKAGVSKLKLMLLSSSKSHHPLFQGSSWNAAFKQIQTPYTLVARNILRFDHQAASLDRLIRLLTGIQGVAAVGGAVRNATGYWKVGCFQTKLKNYALSYEKGYHFSQNESMLCDYIDGPFLVYTTLLKQIPLDTALESSVIFQDFFLSVSKNWLVLAAPDVMFYADAIMSGGSEVLIRNAWLNFAKKRELNRILIDLQFSHVLHKYSCQELSIDCSTKLHQTKYFTVPVCCQEEFARAIRIWDNFCKQNNLNSQFDSGSALGAVKMADLLPWDLDGDAAYPEVNYTFIKNSLPYFRSKGLLLDSFDEPKCCDKHMPNGLKRSYLKLKTPKLYVEMWGDWWPPRDTFLFPNVSEPAVDIRIEIHGVWVDSVPNPGHFSRKRYGIECLRHAQSWIQTGKKTSWEPYESGIFIKCSQPGHHSCLDRFPTDGSIAFKVPEW